jgi:hypothetical protein
MKQSLIFGLAGEVCEFLEVVDSTRGEAQEW